MDTGIEQIAGTILVVAITLTLFWWNFGKIFFH